LLDPQVRRKVEHGISDIVRDNQGIVDPSNRSSGRLGNAETRQEILEPAAVFGEIDCLDVTPDQSPIGSLEGLGEINRGLAAKLRDNHRPINSLVVEEVSNTLLVEGFEVKAIGGVEVGTYRLRV
jgi:hypothetical protein